MCELRGKHLTFPGTPARMGTHLVNYHYVYCVARAIALNLFVRYEESAQVCLIIIMV